jgi:NADPH:quinone reductase-like Zn-dependent oxidoreductase
MRAAVLHTHGAPPSYGDHPDPVAGAGEVLVRVNAAPVVPLDVLCASGTSYFGAPALPYVPGVQGVGVAETGAHAGSRVWFATGAGMRPGDGSLGELCAVREEDVVALEASVDDAAAAAIGLSGVAAWMALTWRGAMAPGEAVVVLGAGGAVGQVALAAARARGAARVVGVCRGGSSVARAATAGADEVVELPVSGDAGELAAAMQAALGGRADLVVDPVGGWVAEAALRSLAPGGRLVNLGGSAGDASTWSSAVLRGGSLSVLGYTNNAITPAQRAGALREVWALAESGRASVAHDVHALADLSSVWAAVAAGDAPLRQVLLVRGT